MDDRNLNVSPDDLTTATPEEAPAPYAEPELGDDKGRYAAPAPVEMPAAPADSAGEIDDDDDDPAPTEWVPTRFEKRVKAIPESKWNLYQCLAGAAIAIYTVLALFFGGQGLNPLFLVGVVLALVLPRWLEDRGRRSLYKGRKVMLIVMAVTLVALALIHGFRTGFNFFEKKEEAGEAARIAGALIRL